MKRLSIVSILAAALALNSGCAFFSGTSTTQDKADQVKALSYAAASIGTQVTLSAHPEYRLAFEVAYNDLGQLLASKVVTGAALRNIIATLPVKELSSPNAKIAIEQATFLYDVLVGDKINIENSPYVLAATQGVYTGIGVALGKPAP